MGRKELQADKAYSAFLRRVFRTRDHFIMGLQRRVRELATPHVFSRVDGMAGRRLSISWLTKSDFTGPVPLGRESHHEGSSVSKRVAAARHSQASKFQPPERSSSFFDDLRSASLLLQPSAA